MSTPAEPATNGDSVLNGDLSHDGFPGLPPFPDDVPTAPLLRISLAKLLVHDQDEENRFWKACCELGFFYIDLRTGSGHDDDIDGEALLQDAEQLFQVQEEFFGLPVEEKLKYDFKEQGSYFGYKGYGGGLVDKSGTPDRNEFYNTSKDDILGLSSPLPAPENLTQYRPLFASYMRRSHAVVALVLRILNARLGLPAGELENLHRLEARSGDQVRFVKAPPQPPKDRRTALGEHTDFGSVTVLFNRLGGLQVRLPSHIRPIAPAASEHSSSSNGDAVDGSVEVGGAAENWAYVRPLPGHAIVNLGDAMVKFTAGVLRSNIHCVVNPPGVQAESTRYSLVYFARPEDEVVLRALRGGKVVEEAVSKKLGSGEKWEEEEVSSKEWVLRRALGRRGVGSWEKSEGTEEVSLRKGQDVGA